MMSALIEENGVANKNHIAYLKEHLNTLCDGYTSLESSLLSLIYFAVVGLDIQHSLSIVDKESIIEHVYSLQWLEEDISIDYKCREGCCGFLGSNYMCQRVLSDNIVRLGNKNYIFGNLAMTYSALSILVTLGDDLTRVKKIDIIQSLKFLQEPNGSFKAVVEGGECDLRFVFCALAISYYLNDFSAINIDLTVQYIHRCMSYEGGFGLIPGSEAHGGSTYCALASLALLDRMNELDGHALQKLRYWCIHRQHFGFQGRTGKDSDSCYSYWIGASLALLNAFDVSDLESTEAFLLDSCQSMRGGFCKVPDSYPDILHTFYSLSWLSMNGLHDFNAIDPKLGICKVRAQQLKR